MVEIAAFSLLSLGIAFLAGATDYGARRAFGAPLSARRRRSALIMGAVLAGGALIVALASHGAWLGLTLWFGLFTLAASAETLILACLPQR